MKLTLGLNPYGLAYTLGMQGKDTPRANPEPKGLDWFIALTTELGGRLIELWDGWLKPMSDDELRALKSRLDGLGLQRVLSSGLQHCDMDLLLRAAKLLDTRYVRLALTPILCGDRATAGERWPTLVQSVHDKLADYAPRAAEAGVTLLIENHQDFTSRELVALCEQYGSSVRIVFDMANTFPVAESPLDFTRIIAPHVRYCHVKDYRAQFTEEGLRLVRCPTGDGCVPHREIFDLLAAHNDEMLAAIEIGALEARHVRLLTPDWWNGYAPIPAEQVAACLFAAQRNKLAEIEDCRTPWERNEPGEAISAYELDQYRRSAANMRAMGLM